MTTSRHEIKTLLVSGKELNKSVFKQLPDLFCFPEDWRSEMPEGELLGRVNYSQALPEKWPRNRANGAYICHLLISNGNTLYKLPVVEIDKCWGDCDLGLKQWRKVNEDQLALVEAIPQIFLRS